MKFSSLFFSWQWLICYQQLNSTILSIWANVPQNASRPSSRAPEWASGDSYQVRAQQPWEVHISSIPVSTHSFPKAMSLPGGDSLQEKEPCKGTCIPAATKGSGCREEVVYLGLVGFCRTQLALGNRATQRASHIKWHPWLQIPALGNSYSTTSLLAMNNSLYKHEEKKNRSDITI